MSQNFNVDAILFAEGKGIFDVVVDDNLVYSKYSTGRFPEKEEVTGLIRNADP